MMIMRDRKTGKELPLSVRQPKIYALSLCGHNDERAVHVVFERWAWDVIVRQYPMSDARSEAIVCVRDDAVTIRIPLVARRERERWAVAMEALCVLGDMVLRATITEFIDVPEGAALEDEARCAAV